MLIESRQQFEAARTILLDTDTIAVDTETNGYHPHMGNRLAGISTFCELKGMPGYGAGFYFPFRHKPGTDLFSSSENIPLEWMRELIPALSASDKTILFHNAKFDMKFLRVEGIEIKGTIRDTAIMSHIIDENGSHKLKDLGLRYIDKDAKDEQKLLMKYVKRAGSFDQVPGRIMEPYAVKDAELTHKLDEYLGKRIADQGLVELMQRRMLFTRCLFEMEWRGVAVDLVLAQQLADEAVRQMRLIEDQLGFDPLKLEQLARRLFGAPPTGLGLLPQALTNTSSADFPHGRPVMDEATLSSYDEPLVKLVLDYRGLVKANSTWYTGFQQKAQSDGRIHPTFNQNGTVTWRLSCSDPNLQQLPRNVEDTPVRRMMTAPERFQLWEFDYKQIEFRLACVYAESDPLKAIFRSGRDIFTEMSAELGLERQVTKMVVYLILYGGGYRSLCVKLGLQGEDHTDVQNIACKCSGCNITRGIIRNFHDTYPGFEGVAEMAHNAARSRGWVQTWNGARRHFVQEWEYRKAFNSIVQGGAGQIMEATMLRFHDLREKKPYNMVCQVHDALWFEVPDDFREGYIEEITELMEWPGDYFGIPFPVDVKRIK